MKNLRLLLLILASLHAASASSQSLNRAGRWEFSPMFNTFTGKSHTFEGGSSAKTSDSIGLGLGVGYNASNQLKWSGELNWNTIDYRSNVVPGPGNPNPAFASSGTMDTLTFAMNGTYHFFPGRLTPLVTGGAGFAYVDTNIAAGPPLPVCWWDPWYGYYCGAISPTRTAYYFSMNVGAGLRWDVSPDLFLQGTLRRQWFDVDSGYKPLDGLRLEIGFRY